MATHLRTASIVGVAVLVVYLSVFAFLYSTARSNGFTQEHVIVGGADSAEYVSLARTILSDGKFSQTPESDYEYFRTPAYPLLLAALLAIFKSVLAIPIAQSVLVAISCSLIYLLGVRYFTPLVGLAAAGFYALDPSVLTTAFVSLSDTLFVLLLLIVVLCIRSERWSVFLVSCVAAGLMVLTRPVGLYILPLLALLLLPALPEWKKALPRALVFLAVASVFILPWMVRNAVQSGHFALSSLSAYNALFFNVIEYESHRRGVPKDEVRGEIYLRLGTEDWMALRSFKYADEEMAMVREYLSPYIVDYAYFHALKVSPFFFSSSIEAAGRFLYAFGAKTGDAPEDVNVSALFLAGDVSNATRALLADAPQLFERLFWLFIWLSAGLTALYGFLARAQEGVFWAALFLTAMAFAVLASPVAMPRYRLPAEPFVFLLAAQGALFIAPVLISRLPRIRYSIFFDTEKS